MTDVKLLQFSNALFAMVTIELGITILSISKLEKAASSEIVLALMFVISKSSPSIIR